MQKKESTKHGKTSCDDDIEALVKRLVDLQVFKEHAEGLLYYHYTDFKRNRLENLSMSEMYKWINKHKKNISIGI